MPAERTTNKSDGPRVPQLLAETELILTVSDFVKGQIIDWTDPEALTAISKQLSNSKGIINKALVTLVIHHGASTDTALDILTKDLKGLKPDKSLLKSDRAQEWWIKFCFGQTFIMLSETTASNDVYGVIPSPSSTNRKFRTEIQSQTDALTKTLSSLKPDDLTTFIAFKDLVYAWRQGYPQAQRNPSLLKMSLDDDHTPLSYRIQKQLEIAQSDAWKKLGENWSWPQISETLSILPNLRSKKTFLAVALAMEYNLIANPPTASNYKEELDIRGITSLLNFRWQSWTGQRDTLDDLPPSLTESLEEPHHAVGMPVPRKYLPTTAIELLTHAKVPDLTKIEQEVAGQIDVQTPWLLTLLALRSRKPSLGTFVDQALNNLINLPPHLHDILLNQQPGQLWLTAEGKISSTKKGGFPIFTSSAVPEIIEEQKSIQQESEEKQPEVNLLSEQIALPFFGTANILRGEIQNLVDLMFQKAGLELDVDKLYDQYDLFSQKWRTNTFDRNLLYLRFLNSTDHYMNLAQKIGIEAVLIKDGNFYFISGDNGDFKTIIGKLDKQGQLHIQDTNPSFIGEPQQLFLNNLALHLVTQPLHESGMVSSYERGVRSDINALAKSWNQVGRGALPKVGFSPDHPFITATLADGKVVLLGEVSRI